MSECFESLKMIKNYENVNSEYITLENEIQAIETLLYDDFELEYFENLIETAENNLNQINASVITVSFFLHKYSN